MEITIQRLGHKGDGIADGPILAPLTLPGETVAGEGVDGRMEAPRILTPSPDRVKAPCRHFRQCGGCALQHASDDFVARWKQGVVETALAAQGLDTPFRPLHTSPPRSRRRATLAGRRTKKGALIGFHAAPLRHHRADHRLPRPASRPDGPPARAGRGDAASAPRAAPRSPSQLTRSGPGIDCAVTGGKPLDEALRLALPRFLSQFARMTWNGETVVTEAPPVQRFGPAAVTPPPGAFLQATPDGEAALLAAMQEATEGATHIVDLFAGCGTFALPLAARAPVHAVEGAPDDARRARPWRAPCQRAETGDDRGARSVPRPLLHRGPRPLRRRSSSTRPAPAPRRRCANWPPPRSRDRLRLLQPGHLSRAMPKTLSAGGLPPRLGAGRGPVPLEPAYRTCSALHAAHI